MTLLDKAGTFSGCGQALVLDSIYLPRMDLQSLLMNLPAFHSDLFPHAHYTGRGCSRRGNPTRGPETEGFCFMALYGLKGEAECVMSEFRLQNVRTADCARHLFMRSHGLGNIEQTCTRWYKKIIKMLSKKKIENIILFRILFRLDQYHRIGVISQIIFSKPFHVLNLHKHTSHLHERCWMQKQFEMYKRI